ncbi:MAG TPA: 4Fe-4S dicluster domain-containing protein [Candidatus Hydrogenedentes bacterium]|nr:4Fe-4S dicluster domain-containing protein [Candidatus Hydrogenedentota bacterium]
MKILRKIIAIDEDLCTGCGVCVPSCHEGAIQIIDGKARLISDRYCDGLGACLGHCPTGALQVVEREAEDFDEEAVKAHLAGQTTPAPHEGHTCPSARMTQFAPRPVDTATQESLASELTHWPVQIRLVPPHAPFLQGADLLVAADCTPIAYANFHRDFVKEKTVMMGCPKFDNTQEYIQRFADIFSQANIKSVTVVVMQVPCCQGLPMIIQRGMEMSGKQIPGEVVILTLQGGILARKPLGN